MARRAASKKGNGKQRPQDGTHHATAYLHAVPTPIVAVDTAFTVTFINQAGAALLGGAPASFLGRKCFELFKTTHCHTAECRCAQAMQRGEAREGETTSQIVAGGLPIRYTAAPLRGPRGEIIGAIEYIVDVTETHRALSQAAEKVAHLDNIPTPVLAVDRDLNVTYINPAGASLVGQPAASLCGRKCFELFRTTHCNTPECRIMQAMSSGQVRRGEAVARPNGNAGTPIEYTAAPIRGVTGQIIGGLEYVVDISERKAVLEEITRIVGELANANLTVRSRGTYSGDFLAITDHLNRGVGAVNDAMGQVADAADQVSAAASQIATGAQAVAEGASEQASAIEETSSSMKEMADVTERNADSARHADQVAQSARATAAAGGAAVTRMIDAVAKIRASSAATAEIIRDINEIAFQTNLLALNAAVEAARAGEAGRGFAVVAEEVRNLAMRAKEAARRTEELIKGAMELADGGTAISAEVNTKFTDIVDKVDKLSDAVGGIARASDEQAHGIAQVNKAVAQMDQVTQRNAASSEESSSAAEELAAQADELAALVGRFQLTRSAPAPRPALQDQHAGPADPARRSSRQSRRLNGRRPVDPAAVIPLTDEENVADF
ncbi:MAG: PAS domain-containing protein [Deltaproteobacteria bacterium]|nr:PAS domain-containing protein [Deltaproteobacteria bacterium]